MTRPILNIADVELRPWGHGVKIPGGGEAHESYEAKLGAIAPKLGAQKLGYGLTVLAPGKKAFPLHHHVANEEMFFVIEGEGEVRIGAERFPIRAGDVIACLPGGAELAHQIINTSKADLKYLGVSTRIYPEVAHYPETKRFGVLGEGIRFIGRTEDSADYWEGEK